MGHELAAFRAMSGRGDTDLYPELVWPMRLALADALHFRRVQGIDLGSALTLILRQHAPGEAQRLGEDFFELGIAVDASPDVADDAAQIGLEPAQASVGALELMGMGIALMLDQRQLADARIGLAQLDTDMRGKSSASTSRHSTLSLSRRVLAQDQRQRGPKVYSLHAPEVECIGKGKAHRPYEFGIKVSVATTAHRSKGGQFVTHIAALPGNAYDGHTLATVIPAMEDMIGNTIERLLADAGYRGHNAPTDYRFRVYTSGQKRRLTPQIKRKLRRRAAIEPVIGHLKAEHRMGRNYLAHHAGDAVNAVLAAAGYNFHLLLRWLELLLSRFLAAQKAAAALQWV